MSVMSVSTVTTPRLSSRTRAADFVTQVVAERGGDAHADQPAAVADLAGLRRCACSSRSARRRCAGTRQLALREGAFRLLGIDLGVVEDAELDRVEAELLRHLVHGDLERHHARRLAGRAHRVAFGQVEHRQPQWPSGGWRRHRAAASASTAVSGLPPGRSPDQLSWPIAVILPSRVAPMRMRWIVAGRCVGVVEHQRAAAAPPSPAVRPRARRARRAARRRA